jgi:hypothetical protein
MHRNLIIAFMSRGPQDRPQDMHRNLIIAFMSRGPQDRGRRRCIATFSIDGYINMDELFPGSVTAVSDETSTVAQTVEIVPWGRKCMSVFLFFCAQLRGPSIRYVPLVDTAS